MRTQPAHQPVPAELELWDIERLAEVLGCRRSYIYRLTHERRIRYLKIGKELRFDPRDVREFVENEKTQVDRPEHLPAAPSRRGRPRATDRATVGA